MARVLNPVGYRTLPRGRKTLRRGAAKNTRSRWALQLNSCARGEPTGDDYWKRQERRPIVFACLSSRM
jgi:hypothetical protein